MTVSSHSLRRALAVAAALGASLLVVLLTAQTRDGRYDLSAMEREKTANADWPVYRGDPKGNQFVPLAQINATNVHKLRPAWEYHTGDASSRSTMYANPIVIDGVMYFSTPGRRPRRSTPQVEPASGHSTPLGTTMAGSSGCAIAGLPIGRAKKASESSTLSETGSMPLTQSRASLYGPLGTMATSTCDRISAPTRKA